MKEIKEISCGEVKNGTRKTEREVSQHTKQMSKKLKDQQKEQQKAQQKVQQRYYCELAKYQEQIRKTKDLSGKGQAA